MSLDFIGIENAKFDIRTHNGTITMLSTESGNHRTFRIRTRQCEDTSSFWHGKRVVGLLTGPDNRTDYIDFGHILDYGHGGAVISIWSRFRTDVFLKYAKILRNPQPYAEAGKLRFYFEGKCRMCNRPLTTPESVASGIGPICGGR